MTSLSTMVCIITNSTLASPLFKGLISEHGSVKWAITAQLNDSKSPQSPTVVFSICYEISITFASSYDIIFPWYCNSNDVHIALNKNCELWNDEYIFWLFSFTSRVPLLAFSWHGQLTPCPHYAQGIWKRIKCFPSPLRRRNWKMHQSPVIFDLCLKKTTSFSKSYVFEMFSVHTQTKSWRFQIPPVWRAFSKGSVFVTD